MTITRNDDAAPSALHGPSSYSRDQRLMAGNAKRVATQDQLGADTSGMLTIFGACAVTFMMLMYAFERRDRRFILAFAFGCALSSVYGFLAGTWPFGVVEAIWAAIALRRYVQTARAPQPTAQL
jgi:hypothetical protein